MKPDNEKMPELLPCPWCGAEARSYLYGLPSTGRAVVHCSNENCAIKPEYHCVGEDAAIALWNTRHKPPVAQGMRDVDENVLELAIDCGEQAYQDTEGDLHYAIKEAVLVYADSIASVALSKFEKWYLNQSVLNTVDKTPSGLASDDIYCKPATRRAWATWRAAIATVMNGGKGD